MSAETAPIGLPLPKPKILDKLHLRHKKPEASQMAAPKHDFDTPTQTGESKTTLTGISGGGGKEPKKKRWLVPTAVVSAVAAVGGGAALINRGATSGENPTSTTAPAVATTLPDQTVPSITDPVTVTTETPTTEAPKPENELQSRFDAFFNMTDEEFNEYAELHPFVLSGTAWQFPDWVVSGGQSRMSRESNPDRLTYTKNGQSNTIEVGPHFSLTNLVEITPKDGSGRPAHSWQFLGFNLGVEQVPIQSGDYQSADIMYMGIVLPQALGGDRFVLPVTVNVDTNNPDKQNQLLFTVPYARSMMTDSSVHDGNAEAFAPIDKEALRQRLKESVGKPIMSLFASESAYPTANQVADVEDFVPDPSGLLHRFESLLLGDTAGFQQTLETAAAQGLIMTSTHPNAPAYIEQGFTDVNEVTRFAPRGSATFMKTSTGPASLQS